jgi:pimeloyl-ACP methyl ester carboxylesterase
MRRRQLRCAAKPVLEGLEERTLLSVGMSTAGTRGNRVASPVSHASQVERARLTLDLGERLALRVGGSQHSAPGRGRSHTALHQKVGSGKIAAKVAPAPMIVPRLGVYVAPNAKKPSAGTGKFMPVDAGSIGLKNTSKFADNVYVIAHGWMPGYIDWVNKIKMTGKLPLSWQTWQGPDKPPNPPGPSTTWLYQPQSTTYLDTNFTISATGLAQQILSVDPHATVLAFSWIDESATSTANTGYPFYIPTKGYQSEANTTMAGMQMAAAIMKALAPGYAGGLGKVHLIGHSHGARVATVAALALQQAAATKPRFDVVRQLTLLDSPESTGTSTIGAANFDWWYLAQLKMVDPVMRTGTVESGQPFGQVKGLSDTSGLHEGMGVTGPGIPAGTTITNISKTKAGTITLSAPIAVGSGSPVNLGFWNWGKEKNNIFVDNYDSEFGEPLNSYSVNFDNIDPNLKIDQDLKQVVDVELGAYSILHGWWLFDPFDADGVALAHEYAAMWYAGSASPQSSTDKVGLLWSPLIANASVPVPVSSQNMANVSTAQFTLTPTAPAETDYPNFTAAPITPDKGGNPVSTVTLSDAKPGKSQFTGTLQVVNGQAGFAFQYDFTKADDGAQLQILLNNQPYFVMTGSVAESLTGNGVFTATFGFGQTANSGTVNVTIRLVQPATGVRRASGSGTQVTLNDFATFTG